MTDDNYRYWADTEADPGFKAGVAWRDANPSPEVQVLIKAATEMDNLVYYDASEAGACLYCEANLHANAVGRHAQLNGDPCPVETLNKALRAYRASLEGK